MKYIPYLIFLFVSSFQLNAQEEGVISTEAYDFESWERDWIEPLKEAYIFADACKLRSEPSSGSEILAKLLIGDRVKVLKVSDADTTINGIQSKWIQVESGKKKGYVWGGLLTNQVLKVSDTTSAVWGISKIVRSGDSIIDYYASIRIFSRTQIKKQVEFEVTYGDQPGYGKLIMIKNPLLEGVEQVFIYHTFSEACGVTASEHYLIDTGNSLRYLDVGQSIGEAALFHSSVELVFPTKEKEDDYTIPYQRKPEKDQILKITYLDEYDENCVWTEHTTVESFEWKEVEMLPFCRD